MVKLNLRYRLCSFSLIESITAMVLILIVFFITLYFFVVLNTSGFNLRQHLAGSVLNAYVQMSLRDKNLNTKKERFDNWTVSRENIPHRNSTELMQVVFTIYKNDSLQTPFLSRVLLVNTRNYSDSSYVQP